MAELALIKTPQGLLAPSNQEDVDVVQRWKVGDVIRVKATKMRNGKFHRKFFALLQVGFDAWEPAESEYHGLPVQKNFERFRKDVIIATGRYSIVVGLDGKNKLEAHSMSFANMDDLEFERLYSDAANVILQRILTHYTKDDLDNVVQQVLDMV